MVLQNAGSRKKSPPDVETSLPFNFQVETQLTMDIIKSDGEQWNLHQAFLSWLLFPLVITAERHKSVKHTFDVRDVFFFLRHTSATPSLKVLKQKIVPTLHILQEIFGFTLRV
jgi:hypothetical protein